MATKTKRAPHKKHTTHKPKQGLATGFDEQQEFPSAFSLFKPSWEGLQQNLNELIVIYVIPSAILLLFNVLLVRHDSMNNHPVLNGTDILVGTLSTVYYILVAPAIIHIQLKSALMEKASYASAWAISKKYWLRVVGLSIVLFLTVLIGLILLIVPGVIFLKRYYLSLYVLIDQDLGIIESMKKSNELSRERSMTVYGILGVSILIVLPSIVRVVGQFISFILVVAYFCAPAIRYQQLKAKPVEN